MCKSTASDSCSDSSCKALHQSSHLAYHLHFRYCQYLQICYPPLVKVFLTKSGPRPCLLDESDDPEFTQPADFIRGRHLCRVAPHFPDSGWRWERWSGLHTSPPERDVLWRRDTEQCLPGLTGEGGWFEHESIGCFFSKLLTDDYLLGDTVTHEADSIM